MDFSFTEEQNLLRNLVQSFIRDNYSFDQRGEIIRSDVGMSRDYWRQFAELGLLAAPFSEELGGLGGGEIETMIIMEELGKGLVVEPYLTAIILCGGLLSRHGSSAQRDLFLRPVLSGESIFALAYSEPQSRYDLSFVRCRAKSDGDGYILNGAKSVVLGGPWADHLIVSVRVRGDDTSSDGIALFVVDKSASGVSTRDYMTCDGMRACEVVFENVPVSVDAMIGTDTSGLSILEETIDYGIAAVCGEAIGHMKAIHDATLEYSRTRQQFGVSIGSFQVLQHRLVDMLIAYEQSVSMTYMVNIHVSGSDRVRSASAAKVQIGKAAHFIGQNAVQLHGGMGMAEELSVGHYFKRLTMIDTQFGNIGHHLRRFATGA